MTNEIDAVIAWVDGNDPAHQKKIKPYLTKQARLSDDIAGPTRYRSEGEIFYCVASILKFAPFIRKIFIVTDQQNPQIDEFIERNFPHKTSAIEIVDHTTIFTGYEDQLPVFNSRAVETCIFRIPDLSENYVYFNDDFFLIRPVKISDWFVGDKIVAYGQWRSLWLDKLLWLIKPLKHGHKPVGFKDGMIAGARQLNYLWKYFHLDHMPHPLKKSVISEFYTKNPHLLKSNISYKFRSNKQFNTHEVYYLRMFEAQRAILKPSKQHLLYMKPVARRNGYIERKLSSFSQNTDLKFCCIGSIDMATKNDREQLFEWLRNILDIKF